MVQIHHKCGDEGPTKPVQPLLSDGIQWINKDTHHPNGNHTCKNSWKMLQMHSQSNLNNRMELFWNWHAVFVEKNKVFVYELWTISVLKSSDSKAAFASEPLQSEMGPQSKWT